MIPAGPSVVVAPWTEEQVRALRVRQANPDLPYYSCGNDSTQLVPTSDGWICLRCGYTQNWAHAADAGLP